MAKPKFKHISADYTVEALKLTKSNARQLLNWYYKTTQGDDYQIKDEVWRSVIEGKEGFSITSYSGKLSYLNIGDYLVRDMNGFFTYQCKEFEDNYTFIKHK